MTRCMTDACAFSRSASWFAAQRLRCLQQRGVVQGGCALCKSRTVQASDFTLGNNLVV